MTPEQLKEGNSINDRIRKLNEFKKAFNNQYINYIKAVDFNGDTRCDKHMDIKVGSELHCFIKDYIDRELKKMELEFKNL